MKCFGPFFHQWQKWVDGERGEIVSDHQKYLGNIRLYEEAPSTVIGLFFYQRRECSLCGRKQMRRVTRGVL